jgi:hypothetical protein
MLLCSYTASHCYVNMMGISETMLYSLFTLTADSVGGICTYRLARFWRLVVSVVFCVMSSVKQIGYPVPTLCRKVTTPMPTGIVERKNKGPTQS